MTEFAPGNYSVHYMEQIDSSRATCPPKWMANLQWLNGLIERGQHFVLPDDGHLIEVKDMPDEMPLLLRPSYPVTVIEYQATAGGDDADPLSCVSSSKRIVVAFDDVQCGLPPFPMLVAQHGPKPPANGVWIVPISFNDGMRMWSPPTAMCFIGYDDEVKADCIRLPEQGAKLGLSPDDPRRGLPMSMAGLAVEIFNGDTGHVADEKAFSHLVGCCAADSQAELYAYQQLCITLACSNVGTDRLPAEAKLNRSREKSRKRPFFDYHILTIPTNGGHESSGKSDRQMRTHLRRGHIRRLPGRLIWINAVVVKGGAAGFVGKSYNVRPGE